ncbi:hypothetical protein [Marinobacterium aestuariivivens]|uniref:Uncharacterized protein n=1 Tax=Marinobacterium aestuariivivens TaxID=1698799 RepID=A0ABW2A1X7_9GAMM
MSKVSQIQDLAALLRARTPLIAISSHDEQRVERLLLEQLTGSGRPLFKWSLTEGLARLDTPMPPQRMHAKPVDALGHIRSVTVPGIYLLADLHPFLDDPLHVRLLKDIALDERHTLVLVSHELEMPAELEKHGASLRLALPDGAELEEIVRDEARLWAQHSGTRSGPVVGRWRCWSATSPASAGSMHGAWRATRYRTMAPSPTRICRR